MFNLLQVVFLLLAAMEYQTNVINAQPQVTVTQYTVSRGSSEWSTNACDCCEDCGICTCLYKFYGNMLKFTNSVT